MKAIANTAVGRVELIECPTPEPQHGQVRIKTAACGICASDIEIIDGKRQGRVKFPAIPGHEWSGVVDKVGPGVDPGLTGMPCVADNVISDGGEVGFEHPGGYGQFFVTDARNLRKLPKTFPLSTAALIEPLAVGVRGIKRLRLEDRSAALIIGDGTIGLISVALLKMDGVQEILCVGGRPARLGLAQTLGATRVMNYHEVRPTLLEALQKARPDGFANVIEASGAEAGITAAFACTAKCGKLIIIGDYGEARTNFRWNTVLHRELELIGSNASAGAWDDAVKRAVSGKFPLEKLVSAKFKALDFAKALDTARSSREVVKVVMEW